MSADAGTADQMKRSPSLKSNMLVANVRSNIEEQPGEFPERTDGDEDAKYRLFLKRSDEFVERTNHAASPHA